MSHPVNAQYLENAHEALDRCVAIGNYPLCREVIKGIANNGFESEAHELESQLLEIPISNFNRLVWK